MEIALTPQFLWQLATAVAVGGAVYGAVRVDLKYMKRDIERLRQLVHSPDNPKNILAVLQDHETRLSVMERVEAKT